MKPFLSIEELAERYGLSVNTIRSWRQLGTGPVATKIGGALRYAMDDVLTWEKENRDEESAQ
jgi:DNA-binding transcriptional MerR regulator